TGEREEPPPRVGDDHLVEGAALLEQEMKKLPALGCVGGVSVVQPGRGKGVEVKVSAQSAPPQRQRELASFPVQGVGAAVGAELLEFHPVRVVAPVLDRKSVV